MSQSYTINFNCSHVSNAALSAAIPPFAENATTMARQQCSLTHCHPRFSLKVIIRWQTVHSFSITAL